MSGTSKAYLINNLSGPSLLGLIYLPSMDEKCEKNQGEKRMAILYSYSGPRISLSSSSDSVLRIFHSKEGSEEIIIYLYEPHETKIL